MFVVRSRSSVRGISPCDEWRLRWDDGSYACESPVVHGMLIGEAKVWREGGEADRLRLGLYLSWNLSTTLQKHTVVFLYLVVLVSVLEKVTTFTLR